MVQCEPSHLVQWVRDRVVVCAGIGCMPGGNGAAHDKSKDALRRGRNMSAVEVVQGDSLCFCGRPIRHRGMCRYRWAMRRPGEGVTPRPMPKHSLPGTPKRRFTEHTPAGNPHVLGSNHAAVTEGRTLFAARRTQPAMMDRLLKGGENNCKIGGDVVKGHLRGCKVFTLTLERATCPRACAHWASCYGNSMNWPSRIQADGDLMPLLDAELRKLCARHDRILVRLHVLGDFFSTDYVAFWRDALDRLPGLHVYGYTARNGCEIAGAVDWLNEHPRAWIRFSDGEEGQLRAVTVDSVDQAKAAGAIVCPAQNEPPGKSICCGTCALCWSTPKTIAFLRH